MKKEKVTLSRIDKVEFFFNKYLGNGIFIYYKIKGRRIKFIVNLKYKLFDSNRDDDDDDDFVRFDLVRIERSVSYSA